MNSISVNHNFNSVVNSVKDFAVSVKQFVEVRSKEFINFLGRNVTWLKNEHPKAAKAALIAGTVFVVGTVVVVIYKKCCAKKVVNKALNDAAKKTAQSAGVDLSNKKSEETKAEELAAAKLAAEQEEQAKKEANELDAKAKQAAEVLKVAEDAKQVENAKKITEVRIKMEKLATYQLKETSILLAEIDTEILLLEPITVAKKQAYVVFKDEQIAANQLPLIKFKSDEYTREDAIVHFTSKQFLDSDGKGIAYDGAIMSIYLNLYYDFHDEYKKLIDLKLKKSELLNEVAGISMYINSIKNK